MPLDIKEALAIPAPCDACVNRERCAQKKLACRDYARFLDDGRVRDEIRKPTRRIFDLIEQDGQFKSTPTELRKRLLEEAGVTGLRFNTLFSPRKVTLVAYTREQIVAVFNCAPNDLVAVAKKTGVKLSTARAIHAGTRYEEVTGADAAYRANYQKALQ